MLDEYTHCTFVIPLTSVLSNSTNNASNYTILISHHALSDVRRNTVPAGRFKRACVKFSDPFVGTTLGTSRTRIDSREHPLMETINMYGVD